MRATIEEVNIIRHNILNNQIVVVIGHDSHGQQRTWAIESYKLARALDALRRYNKKKYTTKIIVREG